MRLTRARQQIHSQWAVLINGSTSSLVRPEASPQGVDVQDLCGNTDGMLSCT